MIIYIGPAAPYNVQIQPYSDPTSATLQWLPGDNSVVDRYYIRWINDADQTDTGEGYSAVTSYGVTGLQPGATYSFNVAAQNVNGISQFSETVSYTVEEPLPGKSMC